MSTTTTLSLAEVIALIQPNEQAVADGRRRMADVWQGLPTDSLPILFGAPVPEPIAWNSDMRRHVADDAQMLYDSAAGLVSLARTGSDAQLGIRADTGTGTLATIAGCGQILSEKALPWNTHLTRAEIDAFDPHADYRTLGVMPRVQALYAYFRANLPDCVHPYAADTQSPFDLAHLLYGDALFYDLYDDPSFVHELLEKVTILYIEGTRLIKGWIGEPLDGGYHGNMAMACGGVRSCEDTATLLSPDLIEEFVAPYRQRALEAFGGGWVHFCGSNDHLYSTVLHDHTVRGLNFGNPERYDFSVVIPQLIDAGKCYAGSIPRDEDETLEAYFRRVIGYTGDTGTGLIFTPHLHGDESSDPRRVLDLWRELQ